MPPPNKPTPGASSGTWGAELNAYLEYLEAHSDPAITPENFGADGDGIADDTAEVQAAFDAGAAGGGLVRLTGTYRCTAALTVATGLSVRLEAGSRLVKDYVAGGTDAETFIRNANLAVKVTGVTFAGPGEVGATSHTQTGNIFALNGDRVRLDGFTIRTFAGGRAVVIAGDNNRIHGLTVLDSPVAIGNGGIRMVGGRNFVATACHVESGDDCLQFVPIADSTSPLYNLSIQDGAYIGCTGRSTAARFMSVVHADPNNAGALSCDIRDVVFSACHGRGGQRGIYVGNAESTGVIDGVTFTDCTIDMAGATAMAEDILIRKESTAGLGDLKQVRLANVRVINSVATTRAVEIQRIDGLTMDGCDISTPAAAAANVVEILQSSNIRLRGTTLRGSGTSNVVVVNATTDAAITDCWFRDMTGTAFGVNVTSSCVRVLVGRNRFLPASGVTTTKGIRFDSTSSQTRALDNDLTQLTDTARITVLNTTSTIRGNAGWNPRGPSIATPAVPASGTPLTNDTGYDLAIALTGGSVSQVAIGGGNTSMTSAMFRLPVGQTITITYAATPIWKWLAD